MLSARFERLRLELLRGGIAPTYIERTILELAEHHADLQEAAIAAGVPPDEAAHWADEALGSEAAIAAAVLARPELRAWSERWPRTMLCLRSIAVLGMLPLLPFALCLERGEVIARWGVSVALALLMTGSLLLSLNWLIL